MDHNGIHVNIIEQNQGEVNTSDITTDSLKDETSRQQSNEEKVIILSLIEDDSTAENYYQKDLFNAKETKIIKSDQVDSTDVKESEMEETSKQISEQLNEKKVNTSSLNAVRVKVNGQNETKKKDTLKEKRKKSNVTTLTTESVKANQDKIISKKTNHSSKERQERNSKKVPMKEQTMQDIKKAQPKHQNNTEKIKKSPPKRQNSVEIPKTVLALSSKQTTNNKKLNEKIEEDSNISFDDDTLSQSLNLSSTSLPLSSRSLSETTLNRRLSSALTRIGLIDTSVADVVIKYGNPSYAVSGFKLIGYTSLFKQQSTAKSSLVISEECFKKLVMINIIIKSNGSVKTHQAENKAKSLAKICHDISVEEFSTKDHVTNFVMDAAKEGEKLLTRNLVHDAIELEKVLMSDNKFSLSGIIDCVFSGKDFLERKHKYVVQIKYCTDKYIPSKFLLELFLYAASIDIPTVYILVFHIKDATVALYEIRFKYDQLREFNRGTTRKLICENFYKNHYHHGDYKLVFKDRKDLKL